jgi:hypothetical protein
MKKQTELANLLLLVDLYDITMTLLWWEDDPFTVFHKYGVKVNSSKEIFSLSIDENTALRILEELENRALAIRGKPPIVKGSIKRRWNREKKKGLMAERLKKKEEAFEKAKSEKAQYARTHNIRQTCECLGQTIEELTYEILGKAMSFDDLSDYDAWILYDEISIRWRDKKKENANAL